MARAKSNNEHVGEIEGQGQTLFTKFVMLTPGVNHIKLCYYSLSKSLAIDQFKLNSKKIQKIV